MTKVPDEVEMKEEVETKDEDMEEESSSSSEDDEEEEQEDSKDETPKAFLPGKVWFQIKSSLHNKE